MRRRIAGALFASVCIAGCRPAGQGIPELPPTIGGGAWARQAAEQPALEGAPALVKRYQPKEWARSEYRKGESSVRVNVFRMPGEPSAFEARQQWLGQAGAASMNHGSLFVIVESATEPEQELGRFLRLLEGEWLSAIPR